ncbi:hypothetical protein SSX86_022689 [Deinandra increscens subsp. villosa]|uniref:non-specific serine/threonine protein kinase n=1 Tax=Deinandra increscens subsp. villosa TaxID=3103831 RepID=A0AAP0CJJ7_9ASTR
MSSSSDEFISSSSDEFIPSAGKHSDYDEFLEVPFEEIKSATDNFSAENLLAQGTFFKVYKGQIERSGNLINIVVRKCQRTSIAYNEVVISKNLKHKNIVSPLEADEDENGQILIINKYEANGSLDRYVSDTSLTWMRRLHICVGVARALNHLHHDVEDTHCIMHANIKSSKILLDHNWDPKLHGFGFAVRAKKHHLHVTDQYKGSLQYMDPAYEHTGGLTPKSDVFSFGVLLFEILFGREASLPNNDNWYFARSAGSCYEDRKLDDLIDPDLRKQMNLESLNIYAETAYWCLKEKRSQRPNMNQILLRLERALELQRTHEHLAVTVEGTSSNHLKGKNLERLKFRLSDLELATNKFSNTYCIGSGGYGMVYKAELDHFDAISSTTVEGNVESELSKKRSTVAIKRIFSRVDGQGEQGFFAEIEMLSNSKHPNIVSLLGFCVEGPEMLLVYEYASNGSLDDYLGNIDNMTNLTWAQRIQICIDIAHGLNHLHTSIEGKQSIIHRDIKSANILLDSKWGAKIADFGLSKLQRTYQQGSTLFTNNIAGTEVYLDPEYLSTGKLKTKSDIYSFGVVMFEIMCGKLAYDKTYNEGGLPSVARRYFENGTWEKLVDPRIREADENIYMLNGGVNQDSLNSFSNIAFQCLAKTQSKRPTMKIIIKELEKALNFQINWKDDLRISLQVIKLGTENFSDCNSVAEGRFWKLYEGELAHTNGCSIMFAKRWHATSRQGHVQFLTEREALLNYKHKNIIGLVGYCSEMNEKIIVYEHASKGRLDKHLANPSLTWIKRLKICIDVANGLNFLHTCGVDGDFIKHRDIIKSSSILLDDDWSAKISNLELSRVTTVFDRAEHVDDEVCDSFGYVDLPTYKKFGFLTDNSDIYSLGVILLEILCGRLAWTEGCVDHSQSLGPLALRHHDEKGNLEEMVFDCIKEQMAPKSLYVFQMTAINCVMENINGRPSTDEVVEELYKALKFQEDYGIQEPKLLSIDYKNIFPASKTPKFYHSIKMKKDLYDMSNAGVLLHDGKVWLSLGSNGERNEMISARKFSYKNRRLLKWQTVQISRFQKAAKMLDITKLKIRIRITTQFLSPGVNYGAYIIFRFCDARKFSSKPMYVGLKYRKGSENLHAYFATWRDDKWMMIELCRFLCHNKDTNFEVELESFSRYYCRSDAIYIEGIEFRPIDRVKNEEIEEAKEVLNSNSKKDYLLPWDEVKRKKHLMIMLSAKGVSYNSFNVKDLNLKHPAESRFKEVIEVVPQQVFRIKLKIPSQMLSPDTKYACYLVFKLTEKCHGLHCPVKVRDLLHRNNKEVDIIYFRSPCPWNLHRSHSVPEQREDGWMEVKVWKVNSSHQLRNDYIPVNLKLITYEGTMSGLVVCGLEFRSM